ncbi:hypothetical protein BH605_27360 [Pseudomonas aeruginosa]|nr:hypothetical protein EGY26_31945 [Pseudomonas aeruginosa]AYZ61221.1 hypothetical protein EGY26_32000 [Pseudomonas aeruginosa]AYZ61231.1 hypothetical protein EGY26_32055 [Pseudomonas aeruginosa]KSJ25933.1 hypothetical protein AO999_24110 [Pseudomonas aeruginosa]KSN73617.1 hypothetical protein APA85_21585 [Pseudomonas aeruginosa]
MTILYSANLKICSYFLTESFLALFILILFATTYRGIIFSTSRAFRAVTSSVISTLTRKIFHAFRVELVRIDITAPVSFIYRLIPNLNTRITRAIVTLVIIIIRLTRSLSALMLGLPVRISNSPIKIFGAHIAGQKQKSDKQ